MAPVQHPGCVSCAPGQYDHDNSPTTECVRCAKDTYSSTAGATTCESCPPGLFSAAGSTTIDACDFKEPAYLGCYNDSPDMVVLGTMEDIDLASQSRDACAFICSDYLYMGLTWTSQCRW